MLGVAQGCQLVHLKLCVALWPARAATRPRPTVRRDSEGGAYIKGADVTDHKKLDTSDTFCSMSLTYASPGPGSLKTIGHHSKTRWDATTLLNKWTHT